MPLSRLCAYHDAARGHLRPHLRGAGDRVAGVGTSGRARWGRGHLLVRENKGNVLLDEHYGCA